MIEEKLVVSDTNIFFDLIFMNLLNEFFLLPCEIYTTDFVIGEIVVPEQKTAVNELIRSEVLRVVSFDSSEFAEIIELFESSRNNTSITDCTVWLLAKKTRGRLLTGDSKLRKSAEADSINVSGILYILDNLIEYGLYDKKICADRLEQLMEENHRLPQDECRKRINGWRS